MSATDPAELADTATPTGAAVGEPDMRHHAVGVVIARSHRDRPQTTEADDLALADAIAMTEAEPWWPTQSCG